MASVKVAITLEAETLARVDGLVARKVFPNRSGAVQIALQEKLERREGVRLAAECAKLDPLQEQAMAEEGLGADVLSADARARDNHARVPIGSGDSAHNRL
jgi:Arc/MetJ-type ribon-helix-helix transcriptional regulator